MKLSIDNLTHLLRVSFDAQRDADTIERNGQPILCLTGAPGIGKTSLARSAASVMYNNVVLKEIIGSSYGSEDMGINVPNFETKRLEQFTNGLLIGEVDGAEDADLIVCFLDELDKWPGDIQAMLLSLIESRKFHGKDIDPRVVYVTAMNPPDLGGESDLIMPLHERLTHVACDVDPEGWCHYASTAGINDAIIGFIHWQCCGEHSAHSNDVLITFDPDMKGATPSPRAWSKASTWVDAGIPNDLLRTTLNGTIGEVTTAQFMQFMDTYLSDPPPTLDEIIENPHGAKIPSDHATTFAVISMLTKYVSSKSSRARDKDALKTFVVDAIIEYIERFPHDSHRLVAFKQCCKANALFAENKSDLAIRFR